MRKAFLLVAVFLLISGAGAAAGLSLPKLAHVDWDYTDTIQDRVNVTEYGTSNMTLDNGTVVENRTVTGWHWEKGRHQYFFDVGDVNVSVPTRYPDGSPKDVDVTVELVPNDLTRLLAANKEPWKSISNRTEYYNRNWYFNGSNITPDDLAALNLERASLPIYEDGHLVKTVNLKESSLTVTAKVKLRDFTDKATIKIGNHTAQFTVSSQTDWTLGTFTNTTADQNDNGGVLELGRGNWTGGVTRFYRMDATNATDYSGNATYTTNNGASTGSPGIRGTNSYTFAGVDLNDNDYIREPSPSSYPDLDNTGDYATFEAIIKYWDNNTREDGGNRDYLHSQRGDNEGEGDDNFGVFFAGGGFYCTGDGDNDELAVLLSGTAVCSGIVFDTGGGVPWTHVAVIVNAGNWVEFYRNASLIANVSTSATGGSDLTDPVQIGSKTTSGNDQSDAFTGKMDEVRIFDRRLQPDEFNWMASGEYNRSHDVPSGETPTIIRPNPENTADGHLDIVLEHMGETEVVHINNDSQVNYSLSFSGTGGNVFVRPNMTSNRETITPGLIEYTLFTESTADTTPPTVTIHNPENATKADSTPWLNVTADESISFWQYELDSNGTNITFTPNITLDTLSDGQHNVTVWANDTANNWNNTQRFFTIDTTPPQISFNPTTTSAGGSEVNWIFLNVSVTDVLSSLGFVQESFDGQNSTFLKNNTQRIDGFEDSNFLNPVWDKDETGGSIGTTTSNPGSGSVSAYLVTDGHFDNEPVALTQKDNLTDLTTGMNLSYEFTVNGSWVKSIQWLFGIQGEAGGLIRFSSQGLVGELDDPAIKVLTGDTSPQDILSNPVAGRWYRGIIQLDNTTHVSFFLENVSNGAHINSVLDVPVSVDPTLNNDTVIQNKDNNGTQQFFLIDDVTTDVDSFAQTTSPFTENHTGLLEDESYTFWSWSNDTLGHFNSTEKRTVTVNVVPDFKNATIKSQSIGGSSTKETVFGYDAVGPDASSVSAAPSGSQVSTNHTSTVSGWNSPFDWLAKVTDFRGNSVSREINFTYTEKFVQKENDTGGVNESLQTLNTSVSLNIRGDASNYSLTAATPINQRHTLRNDDETTTTGVTGTVDKYWYWLVDSITSTVFAELQDNSTGDNTTLQNIYREKQVQNNATPDYSRLTVTAPSISGSIKNGGDRVISINGNTRSNETYNASGDFITEQNFDFTPNNQEIDLGVNYLGSRNLELANSKAISWVNLDTTPGVSVPSSCSQTTNTSVSVSASATKNFSITFSCNPGDATEDTTQQTDHDANNDTWYWVNSTSLDIKSNETSDSTIIWDFAEPTDWDGRKGDEQAYCNGKPIGTGNWSFRDPANEVEVVFFPNSTCGSSLTTTTSTIGFKYEVGEDTTTIITGGGGGGGGTTGGDVETLITFDRTTFTVSEGTNKTVQFTVNNLAANQNTVTIREANGTCQYFQVQESVSIAGTDPVRFTRSDTFADTGTYELPSRVQSLTGGSFSLSVAAKISMPENVSGQVSCTYSAQASEGSAESLTLAATPGISLITQLNSITANIIGRNALTFKQFCFDLDTVMQNYLGSGGATCPSDKLKVLPVPDTLLSLMILLLTGIIVYIILI